MIEWVSRLMVEGGHFWAGFALLWTTFAPSVRPLGGGKETSKEADDREGKSEGRGAGPEGFPWTEEDFEPER